MPQNIRVREMYKILFLKKSKLVLLLTSFVGSCCRANERVEGLPSEGPSHGPLTTSASPTGGALGLSLSLPLLGIHTFLQRHQGPAHTWDLDLRYAFTDWWLPHLLSFFSHDIYNIYTVPSLSFIMIILSSNVSFFKKGNKGRTLQSVLIQRNRYFEMNWTDTLKWWKPTTEFF